MGLAGGRAAVESLVVRLREPCFFFPCQPRGVCCRVPSAGTNPGRRFKKPTEIDTLIQVQDGMRDIDRLQGLSSNSGTDLFKYFVAVSFDASASQGGKGTRGVWPSRRRRSGSIPGVLWGLSARCGGGELTCSASPFLGPQKWRCGGGELTCSNTNTPRMHPKHTLDGPQTHLGWSPNAPWMDPKHTPNTPWVDPNRTLDASQTHPGWTPNTPWMHPRHALDGPLNHPGWSFMARWTILDVTLDGLTLKAAH